MSIMTTITIIIIDTITITIIIIVIIIIIIIIARRTRRDAHPLVQLAAPAAIGREFTKGGFSKGGLAIMI